MGASPDPTDRPPDRPQCIALPRSSPPSLPARPSTHHGLAVRRRHGDAVALAGVLLGEQHVPLLVQHVPASVNGRGKWRWDGG